MIACGVRGTENVVIFKLWFANRVLQLLWFVINPKAYL
jgi:hypothetical protein